MFGNRTILYWFRDPQWNSETWQYGKSFEECSRFVPVFCFDTREEQFFNNPAEYHRYWDETIECVETIRAGLRSKGSNLLIVTGSYEVMIPSLSRVLNADEVVALQIKNPTNAFSSNLVEFRNRKTNEIQYNLKMHSISMKFENCDAIPQSGVSESLFLPPFPEINPGNLPNKGIQQLNSH